MKFKICHLFTIFALTFTLASCGSKTKVQVSVTHPKVTKTITETTKTEEVVPLTTVKSTICTNTKTTTSDGSKADPLHTATVPIPQASFKVDK